MSTHAIFPPSSAARWMKCTGSFGLSLQIPEPPSSEYAEEGTRLHTVASTYLAPDAVVKIGDEDFDFLKPYFDHAEELRCRVGEEDTFEIEKNIRYSDWLSGTPDLITLIDRQMEVVDLKGGFGIMVDPVENEQMLTYAFLALADRYATFPRLTAKQLRSYLNDPGWDWPETVTLTIVQPANEAEPVRSWETTVERVLDHGVAIEEAIATALEGRGELVPGDHCRFCRAKAICPKLRGEVVEALTMLPSTMTPAQLAVWLDRAERMEGFIKSVRELAHDVAATAIEKGTQGIPGWALKPKRATRSWADEEAVLAFARKRKIKIWQDKLMSPAMAEKEHPNLPQELRDQIVSISSGTNLVRGKGPVQVTEAPSSLGGALRNLIYRV